MSKQKHTPSNSWRHDYKAQRDALLAALEVAHGVVLWAADHGADPQAITAIEAMARETIAKCKGA